MIKLLVDGVAFQLGLAGASRVWRSVLGHLATDSRFQVFALDRGGMPAMPGVERLAFADYQSANGAADSKLIQRVCDGLGIDLFTTTHCTSPAATPMLLVLGDMVPERSGGGDHDRFQSERRLAIAFAQRYVCTSASTANELKAFYPEIADRHVAVAPCGVDEQVFEPQPPERCEGLTTRLGLRRPYLLTVGRGGDGDAPGMPATLLDVFAEWPDWPFDLLCVGGKDSVAPAGTASLPPGRRCVHARLSDADLAAAYSGAAALLHLEDHGDFCLPVLEAMACGCPVIAACQGSVQEVCGMAACYVQGNSARELREALLRVTQQPIASELGRAGLEQASRFRWASLSGALAEGLLSLHQEAQTGRYRRFFGHWAALRAIQCGVAV